MTTMTDAPDGTGAPSGPATAPDRMSDAELAAQAPRARWNSLTLLAVPIIAIPVLAATLGAPAWGVFGLGAAGWVIALVLRQPVALVASRLADKERVPTIVGWASGPAEELVRLVLVLLVLRSGLDALWAGMGWATVEVVFAVINGFVIASLLTKTDPKSMEAKEILRNQGATDNTRPWWGLAERLSATALHVGFTLLLFAQPWLVVVTIVAHSVTNMITVRLAKRSLAVTELFLAVVGAAALVAGVVLIGGF